MKKLSRRTNIIIYSSLLLTVAAFSIASPISYAKYRKEAEMENIAAVAKPISNLNVSKANSNTYISPVSSSLEYDLTVDNFKGSEINQVAMSYAISVTNISTVTKLPLTLGLFDYTNESPVEIEFTNWRTGYDFTLETGTKKTIVYRLIVDWDLTAENYNNIMYNDIQNILHIELNFEQKVIS